MAELALGLTKTVVEAALNQIQYAIEEEGKLEEAVAQDLAFITGEFQMMQSVLKVANKERAKKNEVVRTWVRQLRDLAFNVEDWVEFVAHLDKDRSKCAAFWWHLVPAWMVPRCMSPPSRDLDDATAEMKVLKSRVQDVSLRATRYNLFIKDSDLDSSSSTKVIMPATAYDPSSSAFQILSQIWRDDTDRLCNVGSLQDLISNKDEGNNNDLQVISLWGGDNLDAVSNIINEAYHVQEFERSARVKLTRPFNLDEVLKSLLAQLLFMGSSRQATKGVLHAIRMNLSRPFNLHELLLQATTENRYLIVLEQVTDAAEWDAIRLYLPDNKKASRIVVSTQHFGTALYCSGQAYRVLELERFSDGRPSVCAFFHNKGSQSAMDKLVSQIKGGGDGVISVYGHGPTKSRVVKRLYRSIQKEKMVQKHRWAPVTEFSQRLRMPCDYGFFDGSLQQLKTILRFANMGEAVRDDDMTQEYFTESLVVVDGVQSTDEWNEIKPTILSGDNKCCVIVVTDNQEVARYCVDDNHDRLVHVSQVDVDEQRHRRIFSCRGEEAMAWIRNKFDEMHGNLPNVWMLFEKWLFDENKRHGVLSVWGMAGIGKTAMVQWACNRQILVSKESEDYCWVDVPHPFSLSELSWRLLLQFLSDDPQAMETAMLAIIQGQDPIQVCRRWLHKLANWILVLDGLRSMDEWDSIKTTFLVSEPTDWNRIIVITDQETVAMHCVDKDKERVYLVKALEFALAHPVLAQKTGGTYGFPKNIVTKCGGLPKLITAVAEICEGNSSMLESINDDFMQKMQGHPSLKGLFSWMQSYLETCKDELKPCIFYLSVFPIGLSIRPMRLTRRWIAEGYCRGTSSHTAEGNGQRLFFELVGLSIIHQQLRRSRYTWKYPVNGFFHEYITSRPMEHNLVFALEGNCDLNSPRVGQHLTVRNDWHRDKNVFESTDFSRLRSFTVFGECRPFMFDPEKIKMTYVRVLDLENASGVTDKDLKHIVEVFPRLKFLSLRGQRHITCLPDSLGRLMQLQTLDVRDTSIATFPEAITKLQKLQYVRVGMRPVPWNEGCSVVEVETPPEDAPMPSMAIVEDTAASAAAPSSIPEPAEDTAEDAPMPSMAMLEDTAASAAAPSSIPEPAEGTRAVTTATEAPRSSLFKPCCQVPVAEGATMAPTTSWLSKLRCRRRRHDNTIFGVELSAGSGQLTTLHTLGVINLGAGKAVNLKELSKLTQLRRLGVCGINADNISEFFSAIKDLNLLESLSVRVDKNKDGSLGTLDSKIFELLPKSLTKKFSLQGHVLPGSWIKKLANVRMLDLEITLEKQQDMTSIIDGLREHPEKKLYWRDKSRTRICLKTIHGGELSIFIDDELKLNILEIVCTCSLQATIGSNKLSAMMLKIHCSSGSSLQLSGLQDIAGLDEVWLKGSYSDALKQNLLQQAAKHPAPRHGKVYFRVLKPRLPKPDK